MFNLRSGGVQLAHPAANLDPFNAAVQEKLWLDCDAPGIAHISVRFGAASFGKNSGSP
jgi:hypothetical protein